MCRNDFTFIAHVSGKDIYRALSDGTFIIYVFECDHISHDASLPLSNDIYHIYIEYVVGGEDIHRILSDDIYHICIGYYRNESFFIKKMKITKYMMSNILNISL